MPQTSSSHAIREVPNISHTVTEDISPQKSDSIKKKVDDPKERKHQRRMDKFRHDFAAILSLSAITATVLLTLLATYCPTPNQDNLIPYTLETLKVLSTTAVGFVLGRKS